MKDPIEEALEKLTPAELPPDVMARLTAARPQPASKEGRAGWSRWFLPVATAGCASAAALAYFNGQELPVRAPSIEEAAPLPVERGEFLLGSRELGVVVAPDQRPYRVLQVEWLERDIVRASEHGPGIRMDTKRREIVPVALEVF